MGIDLRNTSVSSWDEVEDGREDSLCYWWGLLWMRAWWQLEHCCSALTAWPVGFGWSAVLTSIRIIPLHTQQVLLLESALSQAFSGRRTSSELIWNSRFAVRLCFSLEYVALTCNMKLLTWQMMTDKQFSLIQPQDRQYQHFCKHWVHISFSVVLRGKENDQWQMWHLF